MFEFIKRRYLQRLEKVNRKFINKRIEGDSSKFYQEKL